MRYWKKICIWVRSWNCGCLVAWFCYQLIAKPGNKTTAVAWPDLTHLMIRQHCLRRLMKSPRMSLYFRSELTDPWWCNKTSHNFINNSSGFIHEVHLKMFSAKWGSFCSGFNAVILVVLNWNVPYHGYWCPGSLHPEAVSNHDFDYVR